MKNRKYSKVLKIGGSLAITIPESVVIATGLKEGDTIIPIGKSIIVLSLEKLKT